MIKALILIAAVAAVLIIGGVLEVRVHPEKVSAVPGRFLAVVSNPQTQAKARTVFTDLKRRGEQLIVRDETKRTQLALLYVKEDAQHLQELLDQENTSAEQLVPQAELLATSMQRARTQLEAAPIEVVTQLKENSRESLALAQEAFGRLQQQREKYAALQETFTRLTSSLQDSINALVANSGQPESKPGVAGTSTTTAEPTPDTVPQINTVPLNF